ncbi:MAG: metal ABC transporter substrate-binding protein [Phycisphaerales bacterium]|jgi:zinc transport system substrate-binding protein|nr:metal ABC transporter substrate-binding protein [Phycisphaeraceae bacterium]
MTPQHPARSARTPRPLALLARPLGRLLRRPLCLALCSTAALSALAAMPLMAAAGSPAAASTAAPAPASVQRAAIAQRPLNVVVTIAPLRGLVEGLLPPGSSLTVLVPPGVSEHGYEIPPASLARLARADIVVKIGAGLEPQVEKFIQANPRPSRAVIVLEDSTGEAAKPHEHEHAADPAATAPESAAPAQANPAHAHNHDGPGHSCSVCGTHATDPHLWLNPAHAAALTRAVAREVLRARLSPESLAGRPIESAIDEAMTAWPELSAQLARIERIDESYRRTLATAKRRTIIVAHDAFGEIERRYNIRAVAIAGLHAGEPTPAAIRTAIETIRTEGLTTVFIEPQLSPRAAKRIAETTGARVEVLDPLGTGDWFGLMETNLRALSKALDAPIPAPTAPQAAR